MNNIIQIVVFNLDEQLFALKLSSVERTIRIAEITPLPEGPEIVLGVVNIQGKVIPVFNIRRRFRLPEREISLSDHFIIAHTSKRTVFLLVDSVSGIIEIPEQEIVLTEKVIPGMEYIEGVVKLENGMVLIHDLDRFLSFDEQEALDRAMG